MCWIAKRWAVLTHLEWSRLNKFESFYKPLRWDTWIECGDSLGLSEISDKNLNVEWIFFFFILLNILWIGNVTSVRCHDYHDILWWPLGILQSPFERHSVVWKAKKKQCCWESHRAFIEDLFAWKSNIIQVYSFKIGSWSNTCSYTILGVKGLQMKKVEIFLSTRFITPLFYQFRRTVCGFWVDFMM